MVRRTRFVTSNYYCVLSNIPSRVFAKPTVYIFHYIWYVSSKVIILGKMHRIWRQKCQKFVSRVYGRTNMTVLSCSWLRTQSLFHKPNESPNLIRITWKVSWFNSIWKILKLCCFWGNKNYLTDQLSEMSRFQSFQPFHNRIWKFH